MSRFRFQLRRRAARSSPTAPAPTGTTAERAVRQIRMSVRRILLWADQPVRKYILTGSPLCPALPPFHVREQTRSCVSPSPPRVHPQALSPHVTGMENVGALRTVPRNQELHDYMCVSDRWWAARWLNLCVPPPRTSGAMPPAAAKAKAKAKARAAARARAKAKAKAKARFSRANTRRQHRRRALGELNSLADGYRCGPKV